MKRSLMLVLVGLSLAFGCSDPQDPSSEFFEDVVEDPQLDAETSPDVSSDADTQAEPDVPSLPEGERITVMTFNVGRYFDTVCDSGRCGGSNFEALPSEAQFNYKTNLLADAIAQIDPDIVFLQEIEKDACLEALNAAFDEPYTLAVMGEQGGQATLDVAMLVRGGERAIILHKDSTPLFRPDGSRTSFSREFLEVRAEIDGVPVIAFVAHFKSKSNDDPGRRLAEAEMARELVLAAAADEPESLIVFGGDLNDTPGSGTLNLIEEDGNLIRVAEELGPDAATVAFDGGQFIDHIYLARDAAGLYVPGSATIEAQRLGSYAESDHAALHATFIYPTEE